jgi:hypothetical protein
VDVGFGVGSSGAFAFRLQDKYGAPSSLMFAIEVLTIFPNYEISRNVQSK